MTPTRVDIMLRLTQCLPLWQSMHFCRAVDEDICTEIQAGTPFCCLFIHSATPIIPSLPSRAKYSRKFVLAGISTHNISRQIYRRNVRHGRVCRCFGARGSVYSACAHLLSRRGISCPEAALVPSSSAFQAQYSAKRTSAYEA